MLHIIREEETLHDISQIYGVSTEKIRNANITGCIYKPGSCCYIPLQREILFTENEMYTKELAAKLHMQHDEFCAVNNLPGDFILPKNVMISGNSEHSYDRRNFAAIYKVNDINSSFVNLDVNASMAAEVFIDCYKIKDGAVDIPFDYPAINACKINGVIPSLYIDDTVIISEEEIFLQIMHDLSFKEYSHILFNVKNDDELNKLECTTDKFADENIRTSIVADENILKKADHNIFTCMYYKAKRNVFDFTSFTEVIHSLRKHITAEKLGYFAQIHAAAINKKDLKIEYISADDICEIAEKYNVSSVSYDPLSKLCFFRYEKDSICVNVIYEDLRTLYAKAEFLRDEGITKILLPGLSKQNTGICESMYEK